jgi:signal transduction histidine kinase
VTADPSVTWLTPRPTSRARRRWPDSLRGRLLAAFVAVTAAAVALMTVAALVGTSQGLSAQEAADRRELAGRAAAAAADSYRRAAGWAGADLTTALSIASGAGAHLVVRDETGATVTTTAGRGRVNGGGGNGNGTGKGAGPGMGDGTGPSAAGGTPVLVPVTLDRATVGSLTLLFPATTSTAGRPVAWRWVGAAALGSLALALAAAWLITRTLTRPLAVVTGTARAFAAGDRDARTHLSAGGELGALATAFDDAATQVQISEQARRQMSADVAHELRTPLAALQAGLEELRDGLSPPDPTTLARLHDQSLRLGRVVSDLADLSAADAARLTLRPEPVDLAEIARAAATDHEAQLRAAGITVHRELDDAVPLQADPGRLHQVIGNLLQNCTRHCRDGDAVTLTARRTPDGTARLTVADTGPGIPPADLPQVFTRFWHAGSGSGSGLGMPIVRSLVEAHGGVVTVDSDGHHGTQVTIDLPAR